MLQPLHKGQAVITAEAQARLFDVLENGTDEKIKGILVAIHAETNSLVDEMLIEYIFRLKGWEKPVYFVEPPKLTA